MREKRMLQNSRLRGAAVEAGLAVGCDVIIRERSLLKDGTYITRQIRRGTVMTLYPYHFSCRMADGTLESFRYNELLGWEARLIRVKGKKMQQEKAPERVFFVCKKYGEKMNSKDGFWTKCPWKEHKCSQTAIVSFS